MNQYKFIFEKTYSDRCISKKLQREIILESELDYQNQKKELNQLAYSNLFIKHPGFINNNEEKNLGGWTKPRIKEIFLISTY